VILEPDPTSTGLDQAEAHLWSTSYRVSLFFKERRIKPIKLCLTKTGSAAHYRFSRLRAFATWESAVESTVESAAESAAESAVKRTVAASM
jgi:hypothetical protein